MVNRHANPDQIVNHLLTADPLSQWMGIEVIKAKKGFCSIQCTVTYQMLNGYGVAHGGIIFSIADTALAFSAATFGRTALALDNSISFTRKAELGDVLTAQAEAINMTTRTGLFNVRVINQRAEIVSVMKGTVYRPDEVDTQK